MERNDLKHLSTGPTYWPSDRNKLPDLVAFCVTMGIPQDFTVAKSYFDLFNHSPVLITLEAHALNQELQPRLNYRHTNWDDFRQCINERLSLNFPLKPKRTLKQQSSSSTIQYNGQVGTQRQNIQTQSRHVTVLY
jgi:hypothetical protein